jgi:hypothetical protein
MVEKGDLMVLRYMSAALLGLILGGSVIHLDALPRRRNRAACDNKNNCQSLKSKCQCYCSAVGHFRDKNSDDKPVYVENDPNGVHCYCKQWDLDAFPYAERPADQK